MSHPIIYGEKTLDLTSPVIAFNSDATTMTYNGSAILTAASLTLATGTVTGTPTVDTGAVSTYQTRGVATTPGIGTWTSITRSGIPTQVKLHVPSVQMLTFTGAPTILYPFGVTNVLPAAIRPIAATVARSVLLINNTANVTGVCRITTAGVVSLTLAVTAAVTAAFGVAEDFVFEYDVVSV